MSAFDRPTGKRCINFRRNRSNVNDWMALSDAIAQVGCQLASMAEAMVGGSAAGVA
jgi:hypothetical protein